MKTTAEKLDTAFAPKSIVSNLAANPDTISINGAKLCGPGLIDILNMVTQPNPRRWYRFERQGENILVHTKQD